MATDGSGTEAQRPVNKRVVRLSEELSPDGERRLARALSIVLRAAARRIPSAKGSMGGGDEGPDARSVPEQGSEHGGSAGDPRVSPRQEQPTPEPEDR